MQNMTQVIIYFGKHVLDITSKRGRKVTFNMPAVSQYIKRYAGFQALLSNSIKDPENKIFGQVWLYYNRNDQVPA